MGVKKYLLAALLSALLMSIPCICQASATVNDISTLPGSGWHANSPLPMQVIPADAIQSEVNYLSQNKIFDNTPINVDIYNQQVYRISEGVNVLYGGTSFDGNIYIFAGYWGADTVSSAIVHEIGHLIRFDYVTDSELQTYMAMRGVKDGSLMNGAASVKEELFAEDFRTLFGDEHAQVPQYAFYKNITPPDEQDREFILKCISEKTEHLSGANIA
jgi:hypothetical protein